jgi:hypothetical protein
MISIEYTEWLRQWRNEDSESESKTKGIKHRGYKSDMIVWLHGNDYSEEVISFILFILINMLVSVNKIKVNCK